MFKVCDITMSSGFKLKCCFLFMNCWNVNHSSCC